VQSASRAHWRHHRALPCSITSAAFAVFNVMTPKTKIEKKSRIIVVEDHPVLCDGLKQLIGSQPDLTCIAVADSTSDAKRLVEEYQPDLMLLDLRLKAGDSIELIKSLQAEHPEVKVLVLSQYDELLFAERTLRAGARGYIMKENATDEVLRAVRKVLGGELYFSERVAAAIVQRTLREKPDGSRVGLERLSDREMQVFQRLGAAYSAREIADEFHLSRKTVETHCEKIKHKLSLPTAAELKRFARKWAVENLGASEPWVLSGLNNGHQKR
jgi:DNA-binding NarL/FixJ family response regulator